MFENLRFELVPIEGGMKRIVRFRRSSPSGPWREDGTVAVIRDWEADYLFAALSRGREPRPCSCAGGKQEVSDAIVLVRDAIDKLEAAAVR